MYVFRSQERQFLVASIVIEFIVSSCYYLLRFFYLQQLSPGAIFVALFVRSQLTNTVTLVLVFLPKLWYQQKQVRFVPVTCFSLSFYSFWCAFCL